jgi:predicted Zn-ribbon and HTH transcriptional regulator
MNKNIKSGYKIIRSVEHEEYPDIEKDGLEGPYRMKTGKIVYYDKQAQKYYDVKTDMYMENAELEAKINANVSAGDIVRIKEDNKDKIIVIISLEDPTKPMNGFYYYLASDKSGTPAKEYIFHSNMFLGNTTFDVIGSIDIISPSVMGYTWNETGITKIDEQMAQLDSRMDLFMAKAPAKYKAIFDKWEHENLHSINGEMVTTFAEYILQGGKPQMFNFPEAERKLGGNVVDVITGLPLREKKVKSADDPDVNKDDLQMEYDEIVKDLKEDPDDTALKQRKFQLEQKLKASGNKCDHCGGEANFEGTNEGQNCTECGDWVCDRCVDWKASGDKGFVCTECAGKKEDIEVKASTGLERYGEIRKLAQQAYKGQGKDISVQTQLMGDNVIVTLDFKPVMEGTAIEVITKLREMISGVKGAEGSACHCKYCDWAGESDKFANDCPECGGEVIYDDEIEVTDEIEGTDEYPGYKYRKFDKVQILDENTEEEDMKQGYAHSKENITSRNKIQEFFEKYDKPYGAKVNPSEHMGKNIKGLVPLKQFAPYFNFVVDILVPIYDEELDNLLKGWADRGDARDIERISDKVDQLGGIWLNWE